MQQQRLSIVLLAVLCFAVLAAQWMLFQRHSIKSKVALHAKSCACARTSASLDRLLVLVSISNKSHIDALWNAWGYRLGHTRSLKFYSMSPNLSKEPAEVPSKFPGIVNIQWIGYESGEKRTMTYKTKKLFEFLSLNHVDRDWFIKTDDDTLVAVPVLQELLGGYDPSKPWYMGYTWAKGVWEDIEFNSGSFYILSRAALQSIYPLLKQQKFTIEDAPDHEDVMIARLCQQAGIRPLNLAPLVFWSGPEIRREKHPTFKFSPFVAVHNIKDADTLVKMGATLDAFINRRDCYIDNEPL